MPNISHIVIAVAVYCLLMAMLIGFVAGAGHTRSRDE
jgi:hypothetical protein